MTQHRGCNTKLFPFSRSLSESPTVHPSQDCGFGDGGEGVCVPCAEGTFSSDKDVAPCRRCTRCNLLNRLERTGCSPTSDALCGQCLPGEYPCGFL
uniref:TNFR-Cys domain-containing protein n=1 Tax=Scophthalmus maximus TaxID=52904 RepID=A0A8D3AUG8_SCOMX